MPVLAECQTRRTADKGHCSGGERMWRDTMRPDKGASREGDTRGETCGRTRGASREGDTRGETCGQTRGASSREGDRPRMEARYVDSAGSAGGGTKSQEANSHGRSRGATTRSGLRRSCTGLSTIMEARWGAGGGGNEVATDGGLQNSEQTRFGS
jgi:hypothetical protein